MEGRSAGFPRAGSASPTSSTRPATCKLVEIVAGADTAPETLARAEDLCGRLLGKGLVRAKDTPNFIANRIGTFALMRTLDEAVKEGYTVEEVDMVFGPATGRPKSAVFRTADVVGLDTLMHVTRNCHEALTDDERREVFAVHPRARAAGRPQVAGRQDQAGLLQEGRATRSCSSISRRFEYVPQKKPRFASIGATRASTTSTSGCAACWRGDDRAAALARTVIYETLIYSADRLGEIADDVVEIDRAMRWGFGWERGPVRDLGRAGREGDRREDGGRRLHACPAGCRSGSRRRAKGRRFYRQARAPGTRRAARARTAASRRVPERPARDLAGRRARRAAARSSATPAPRSSTSATASSASSSTPR